MNGLARLPLSCPHSHPALRHTISGFKGKTKIPVFSCGRRNGDSAKPDGPGPSVSISGRPSNVALVRFRSDFILNINTWRTQDRFFHIFGNNIAIGEKFSHLFNPISETVSYRFPGVRPSHLAPTVEFHRPPSTGSTHGPPIKAVRADSAFRKVSASRSPSPRMLAVQQLALTGLVKHK